ncbi:MAG: neuraminidase (sialidase)-like protein [Fuerstiella sp.]|nr:neuraminidase (sialidase)-like protein [Fuerstiella sp.]MCP4857185.1 neuraminidase (sialidase)-like protein [Fuerstiella sp.]
MKTRTIFLVILTSAGTTWAADPFHKAEFVFPLHNSHNHAPGIVECPSGDLLVSWYRGSGERRSDDVAVYGARKARNNHTWGAAFLMADTPGFPDCNTCMMVDQRERLWLFWPVIIANSWESCLTHYKVADNPGTADDSCPSWGHSGTILLKPEDFEADGLRVLDAQLEGAPQAYLKSHSEGLDRLRQRLGEKLYQRLGWQPRCKPTVLPSGRILLPLYSDTYSISIIAVSDDDGKSWYASKPLFGFGNIQPALLRRNDGSLVAYMRENGVTERVRVCESRDDGISWTVAGVSELSNPGSGLDGVRLKNGRWLLVYNDTTEGRSSLAVSVSDDEGASWRWTRHLENHESGQYHYPAVIQSRDNRIHVVYSYFVTGGKTMKHVVINEDWVLQGDKQ